MINYNRLDYEIKRDLTNFSFKISHDLKRLWQRFIHQMLTVSCRKQTVSE